MGEWAQNTAVLLKDTISFCSSAKENDNTVFDKIRDTLNSILDIGSIPKALESQVRRTSKLVDHITNGTNDFEKGILKLRESVTRMVDSIPFDIADIPTQQTHQTKESLASIGQEDVGGGNDISKDLQRELENFGKLVTLFETDREMAIIELAIKLEGWCDLFEGVSLNNLQTLSMAMREELLNNPEFHIDTLKRYVPLVNDAFAALATDAIQDISEEILSTIFEVEDSYIHHEEEQNSDLYHEEEELESVEEAPLDSIGHEGAFEMLENERDKPTIDADIVPIPQENNDLIMQFVDNQNDILPLFEALALNYDDNPQEIGDEIRGILHTWKGEFGVLDLQKFSQLCHFLEDEMEKDDFCADTLFRFKDLLSYKLKEIKNGASEVLLTDEEIGYLVSFHGQKKPESLKPKKKENAKKASVDIEQFDEGGQYPMPEDDDLLNGFITESREHLEIADSSILELEKEGYSNELVDSLFRAYHTIKGVASFLSLEPIRFLAHEVENYIDLIRAGKIKLDQDSINITFEGTDILKSAVEIIASSINSDSYTIPQGINEYLLRLQIALKSATLGEKTAVVEKKNTVVEKKVDKVTLPEVDVKSDREPPQTNDSKCEDKDSSAPAVSGKKSVDKENKKSTPQSRKSNLSETVRVPVDRLDQLIDTIGEAVIAQSMFVADEAIASIKKPELVKKIAQAEQIMRQVQELSMGLRMVSIKPTFQKMARLVRDLSIKFDKDIEFVMEGQDTDIDKSLVENIGDPLIHMVRNALDHGIESSAEERTLLGKPAKATVILRAFHKSGSIYIEIEDDGRGLNKEKILQKAIKQGLVKAEQELSENEIFNLIFKPGFSTAEKITDISGRGVGMDVVRRNIMDMRGAIHVSSELGGGTTFSIRLPLTLAIIDGMVVSVCGERYIIPKLSIVESIIPSAENLETVLGNGGKMIKFRGSYLVFSRLEDIFALNEGNEPTKIEENGVIIIIEDLNGKRVGLFVDRIIGQRQVVIKNLGDGMNVDGIAGGAIMSDGSVNLIVDVSSIVSMIQ